MNDEFLALVEDEVRRWPGVSEESGRFDSASFKLGRREIGHLHRDGVADIQVPRAIHDELIAAGRAQAHRAGFPTYVSFALRRREDVPAAIALFRLSYDRLNARLAEKARDGAGT